MIDKNQYNEFYNEIASFDWNSVNDVSDFLIHKCGIDPLPHMYYVPANYRAKDKLCTDTGLHSGIEIIYERAFMDCTGIEKVVIPASVDKVCEFVFKGCTNLKTVRIEGQFTKVDALAFCFLENIRFYINSKNEDMIRLFQDTLHYDVTVVRGK